jgi:hypothetical protein
MASSIASRHSLFVVALVFACSAKIAAAADPSTATVATAQALFDEARKLFDDGRFHEACEKFGASAKIEPREGTLLNLALCHQKEGKTASAWVEFIAARARARAEGHPEREKFATERIDALAATLTRLRLVVAAESRAPGLTLTLDGEKTADAAWNTDIPVDPGPHVVEASAPGRVAWRKDIDVEGRVDHPVAVLEVASLSPLANPSPPPGSPTVADVHARSNGERLLGFSLVGVGIVSVVVGSVFGAAAIDKSHDAQSACVGSECGPPAQALHQEGIRDAWVSDFTIGGGLLVAAVGAYLGLRAGAKGSASIPPPLRASFTGRALILSGSW